MGKPEFVYVTYIGTTPERLWAALTSGELTKQYWYNRRIASDWRVGFPVRFYDGDTDTVTDDGIVLGFDAPRRLTYTFRPAGLDVPDEGRAYTRVNFSLQASDDMVKLTLVHDEMPSEEMADAYREGWAPILSSLKTFLETGKPLPQVRSLEEKGRPKDAG